MLTKNFYTGFIPLTHVLLACVITTIITALAIFHHYHYPIIACYITLLTIFIFTKKPTYHIILFLCALFSLQIYLKIKEINKNYQNHQQFLNTQTITKATILQKQTSDLDKTQTTLLVQTSKIYTKQAGALTTPLKILILMPAKRAQKLFEGQTITIFKLILQQPKAENDYRLYLIKEGIWATAYITAQNITVSDWDNRSWFHQCSTIFSTLLHASTINLFNPLFLGKREKTIDTVAMQHQSIYWGIAHHMARSGIHLVTLFGLFMALFHYMRIKHFYRYIISAILIIGYLQISVTSISFLRAFCMILFQIISKLNKFQYSSVHALTLTTLLMVTHNPYYILFLDFQLSFGITAVIIWLFHAKWAKTVAFETKTLIPS